jgi:hypothetical protein
MMKVLLDDSKLQSKVTATSFLGIIKSILGHKSQLFQGSLPGDVYIELLSIIEDDLPERQSYLESLLRNPMIETPRRGRPPKLREN